MNYRRTTARANVINVANAPFARRRTALAAARPWLVGSAMVAVAWLGLPSARAETTANVAMRWQSSLSDFASADKAHRPERDGVVFVGSSTIRMWQTMAQDFRDVPVVINRGFGGSTLADCQHYVNELVIQYKPRQIMVYAGDNDLAEGSTPAEVLESFTRFVQNVRSELPEAQITYISIKPSPSRESLMAGIRETNSLIGSYLKTVSNSAYIDIYNPMLRADGKMRPELFLPDMLHMNESGYALWRSIIAPHLIPGGSAQQRPVPVVAAR